MKMKIRENLIVEGHIYKAGETVDAKDNKELAKQLQMMKNKYETLDAGAVKKIEVRTAQG